MSECDDLEVPVEDLVRQHLARVEAKRRKATENFCMREVDDPRHGRIRVTEHVYNLVIKDKEEACAQRTPGWYAKRKNHITASQMASICNANKYETRASALKKKVGVEKPFTGNDATAHGQHYEMEAIIKYEKLTGNKCLEFGLLESLNEGEDFLAGSPDGITDTGRLIEVKCPFRRKPTSEIPGHYKYQIQFLMHILRLKECDFIQYVPEGHWTKETFIVTLEKYDPYFWYSKFPILKSFWQEVIAIRAAKEAGMEIEDDKKAEEAEGEGKLVISIDEDSPEERKRKRSEKRGVPQVCKISVPPRDGYMGEMSSMPAVNMPKPREHVQPRDGDPEECQIYF